MDVIVNADDLGISVAVNNAVFDLMNEGLVTSATLMANGPHIEEACRELPRFPQLSFGVHLNATEFHPICPSSGLKPLLNSDGAFDGQKIREVVIDRGLSDGLFEEFCAQIEKLRSLEVRPSHIDSHHYIASMPRLFPILKKVQKKYGIRKVRITRNIYADGLLTQTALTARQLSLDPDMRDQDITQTLRAKKWLYNFLLKNYYRTKTTDGFSGFRLFFEYAKTRNMNHRSFEVVVHPANEYYDPGEVELLRSPWRDALSFPVSLISYHELN